MFAYCGNNPVCFFDPSGYFRFCQFAYTQPNGDSGSGYVYNQDDESSKSDTITVAASFGRYISANLGAFNVAATIETAVDFKGNIQINSSVSFDVTTAGSLSASTGYTGSVFFVPDTSYLSGDTYYMGASASIPIPPTPLAASGSLNVGQTADGYWGALYSLGIAPVSSAGAEVHGGYSYTHAWTPTINILETMVEIIKTIVQG